MLSLSCDLQSALDIWESVKKLEGILETKIENVLENELETYISVIYFLLLMDF